MVAAAGRRGSRVGGRAHRALLAAACRLVRLAPSRRATVAATAALLASLVLPVPGASQAPGAPVPAVRLWRWSFPDQGKRIALLFTGHEFAEGGEVVLDELKRRGAKASFFFTGDFMRRAGFAPLIRRIVADGHYLGPHSDKHLLYCSWEDARTLVTRAAFRRDVEDNVREIERFGVRRDAIRYWVPAYEWANRDILEWSAERGLRTVGIFLGGTRAHTDYMCDDDPKFVPSQRILDSILERERTSGLSGAEVLMHIGAGPCRTDKLHTRIGELLDRLGERGYTFARIDEFGRIGTTPDPGEWLK
jgi:peptidoglycan/xylan/chitin deacetylase (PgdA/CDA1 family)